MEGCTKGGLPVGFQCRSILNVTERAQKWKLCFWIQNHPGARWSGLSYISQLHEKQSWPRSSSGFFVILRAVSDLILSGWNQISHIYYLKSSADTYVCNLWALPLSLTDTCRIFQLIPGQTEVIWLLGLVCDVFLDGSIGNENQEILKSTLL